MAKHKGDLVRVVQTAHGGTLSEGQTAQFVDLVLQSIQGMTSNGDKLILKGFGTFALRHRRASTTRNPRTGQPMKVPATTRLGFKGSKGETT